MRFALILITIALTAVVGFSWVPAENNSTEAVEDSTPVDPALYDTVPVEYIDFEPLHVNVQYVSLDVWDDENHAEL